MWLNTTHPRGAQICLVNIEHSRVIQALTGVVQETPTSIFSDGFLRLNLSTSLCSRQWAFLRQQPFIIIDSFGVYSVIMKCYQLGFGVIACFKPVLCPLSHQSQVKGEVISIFRVSPIKNIFDERREEKYQTQFRSNKICMWRKGRNSGRRAQNIHRLIFR